MKGAVNKAVSQLLAASTFIQSQGLTGEVAVNLLSSVSPDTTAVLLDQEPRTVTQDRKYERKTRRMA